MKNPVLTAADHLRRAWWLVGRPVSVGVLALVVDDDARVLLVEQSYRHGWYLPGGGVKRKEALNAAIRRELREEVGVEPVEEPRLHGVYWNFAEGKSDYVAVFVVERWTRHAVKSIEIESDRFFALHELPEDVSPAASRRIGEWAAGTTNVVAPW